MNLYRQLLEEAARSGRFRPNLGLYRRLWPELLPAELARHSRPCAWDGHTLRVEVDPSWLPAFQRSRQAVHARLRDALPWAVDTVAFEADADFVPSPPASRPAKARPASIPVEELPTELVPFDDPALNARLASILAHIRTEGS